MPAGLPTLPADHPDRPRADGWSSRSPSRGRGKRRWWPRGAAPLVRRSQRSPQRRPGRIWNTRTELVQRLLADTCELCGSQDGVQVHHMRALKDLDRAGAAGEAGVGQGDGGAAAQDPGGLPRLPHGHPRRTPAATREDDRPTTGEPDDAKGSRPVRRGADGKGPDIGTSPAAYPTRRPKIRLTADASRDYEDILLHTRHAWGVVQTATYRAALSGAFGRLQRFPELGQPRNDLFTGCRSVQVEQHVIYYHQPRASEIVVVRILHRRQDAGVAVKEPLP